MSVIKLCPGLYCGRELFENGSFSECGPCFRGFRRNETTHLCEPCTDNPSFYDWLYLGFIAVTCLVLHWFSIDMVCIRRSFSFSKEVLILHFTALFEVVSSALLALFLSHPVGKLEIHSCKVKALSDWYTLVYNPVPNYEKQIHCTQEAVYPLYTIVFVFYVFQLSIMLILRPWVCERYPLRHSKMSIYAAMYYLPFLALVHAIFGGLLYYAFPYLIVVLSVISSAAHFAVKLDQSFSSLIVTTVSNPRNVVILLGHWCLHAYGIISVTQLTEPLFHSLLIMLVPLPAMFYIFTARFTDPNKFQV